MAANPKAPGSSPGLGTFFISVYLPILNIRTDFEHCRPKEFNYRNKSDFRVGVFSKKLKIL